MVMEEHTHLEPGDIPTPEELALLMEKINELSGGVRRLEECYQKLRALGEDSIIEGGTKNA